MFRAAAWAESVVYCRVLERVREAMGASDVKSRDRLRVATGSGGGVCTGVTLGDRRGGTLGTGGGVGGGGEGICGLGGCVQL